MKEEIERLKQKAIEEFVKMIEYHPSHDIGLDQVSRIKQEMGLAILSKLPNIFNELEKAVREEERTRWETAVKYNVDDETLQRIEEAIKVLTNK